MTDPFAAPAPIASEFASAASFKGRLVLIQPTSIELDVPNQEDSSKTADRVTCTVTVVDGQGPVQIISRHVPTGKWLEGPEHKGVWFSQDRLRDGILGQGVRVITPGTLRLGRIETRFPNKGPMKGNPWGLVDPTEADKQLARDFLANRTVAAASAPAAPAPTADDNPFAAKADAPF